MNALPLGVGFRLDDRARLLGLCRRFKPGALLGFHALGISKRRTRLRTVTGFDYRRLCFALLRLHHLIRFRLTHRELRLRGDDQGLRLRFTGDGAGVGIGYGDTLLLFGLLHHRIALEDRRLLADFLFLVKLRNADGLQSLRVLHLRVALEHGHLLANLALLVQLREPHGAFAVGQGQSDLPIL